MDRLPPGLETVLILKDYDGVPKHFRGHASEWPIVLAALEDAKQALAREAERKLRVVGGTEAREQGPSPTDPAA